MNSNAVATSTVMGMAKRNDMEVISADRQASTRAAVMDFSRRFAVVEVPAYDATQRSYAAQMELFSLGFDLLISHRPGATDKQKHQR